VGANGTNREDLLPTPRDQNRLAQGMPLEHGLIGKVRDLESF